MRQLVHRRSERHPRWRRAPSSTSAAWRTLLPTLLACAAAACSASQRDEAPPLEATSSRVDVYLSCQEGGPREVTFELLSIALRDVDGALHPLAITQARQSSRRLERRISLAGSIVPRGEYAALVLRFKQAALEEPEGPVPLRLVPRRTGAASEEPPPDEVPDYTLPLNLVLRQHEGASLFLDWQVTASLLGGADFAPLFTLAADRTRLVLGTLYVADAATGSVLSVDRHTGEVTGTIKVGSRPNALALSRDRRNLYVANAGDGSLSVVDLREGSVTATVPIALAAGSWDVVLTEPDGMVAVANRDIDRVTLVDALQGTRLLEIAVGRAPVRLAASRRQRRLFVAASAADAIDVIDVPSGQVIGRIPTESRPSVVALDRRERLLVVGHTTSPNLLVIDADSLVTQATIFVGADATAVLADRRRDHVYVARTHPNEIAVVDLRLSSVVRRIPVAGRIEALAQAADGAEIHGAAPERGALIVVDIVLGRQLAPIPCGLRPVDVLVAD